MKNYFAELDKQPQLRGVMRMVKSSMMGDWGEHCYIFLEVLASQGAGDSSNLKTWNAR